MIFALALVLAQAPEAAPSPPPEVPDAGFVAPAAAGSDAPVAAPALELTPSPPPVIEADAEHLAPSHGFVKGELSVYLGSDRLSVKRNRVGVSAGVDFFKDVYYILVEPQIDLRFFDAKLGIGLGVPLRLEVFNFNDKAMSHRLQPGRTHSQRRLRDVPRLRTAAEIHQLRQQRGQPLRQHRQRYATSIGHGAIMRRYAPNIDVDYPALRQRSMRTTTTPGLRRSRTTS